MGAAGIADDGKAPLFRSSGRGMRKDVLLSAAMIRWTAIQMVKRGRWRSVCRVRSVTTLSEARVLQSSCEMAESWRRLPVSQVMSPPERRSFMIEPIRGSGSMRSSEFSSRLLLPKPSIRRNCTVILLQFEVIINITILSLSMVSPQESERIARCARSSAR